MEGKITPYKEISKPIPGQEAFSRFDSTAVQSQAAFLLLLGIQAGSDSEEEQKKKLSDILSEEERKQFPFPPLLRSSRERFASEDIRTSLARRSPGLMGVNLNRTRLVNRRAFTFTQGQQPIEHLSDIEEVGSDILGDTAPTIDWTLFPDLISKLISDLYEGRKRRTAAELMEACLFHQDPLVRVAAAASHVELISEWGRPISILEQGTHEQDSLVRDVAVTALARLVPNHPRLAELAAPVPIDRSGKPSHTSLLVHGTWARNLTWWQPGRKENFHNYLGSVYNDLYGADDVFSWSGLYNDIARRIGAEELVGWAKRRKMNGLNHLFAHSHGGSVAMLASNQGLNIKKLVLLSCPVHKGKYMPRFNFVGEVVSIRGHLDLVILVDRGGQRFRHGKIREYILPIWFNHSTTHYPGVWKRYNIPSKL